jgi:hypothetical protein
MRAGAGDPYAAAASVAMTLAEAEAAYAVDADHLARHLIVGLILQGAVTQREVASAVERGLARNRDACARARTYFSLG